MSDPNPDQARPVDMPKWHREEIDRRLADESDSESLSWDDAQEYLKQKLALLRMDRTE